MNIPKFRCPYCGEERQYNYSLFRGRGACNNFVSGKAIYFTTRHYNVLARKLGFSSWNVLEQLWDIYDRDVNKLFMAIDIFWKGGQIVCF